MASVCISDCVKDTSVPTRTTFVNLHKWPESEVEFVKRVNNSNTRFGGSHGHPKGVDSFSCRQVYLRSYKFSREKVGVAEKTLLYFNKIKDKVVFVARHKFNFKTKYKEVLLRAKDVFVVRHKFNFKTKYKEVLLRAKDVFVARHKFNFKTKYKEVLGRAKDVASAAFSIFQIFLLPCSAKIDVLHHF